MLQVVELVVALGLLRLLERPHVSTSMLMMIIGLVLVLTLVERSWDLMIAVITLISIVNSLTSKCDISALVHALPVLIEIRLCHISIL